MKAAIHAVGSLTAINLVLAGVSLATTLLVADSLGVEGFGNLAFAIAVGTYGLMFVQFGLDKSFVRDLVHSREPIDAIVTASIALRVGLLFVFLAGLAAVAELTDGSWLSWGVLVTILATMLPAFQLQAVYDAWRQMRRHAIYGALQRSVYFVLVWIAVIWIEVPLSILLVGSFLLASVLLGLVLQYLWAHRRVRLVPDRDSLTRVPGVLRSNAWVWLAVLSGLSIEYLSQILLKVVAGSSELGFYSVAWRITQFGVLFLAQAGRVGAEATARHTRPGMDQGDSVVFLERYVLYMTGAGLIVGLPCVIAPSTIISLLSPQYSDAASTLRLLGLYPVLYGPYLALLQYVIACRMDRTYFVLISAIGLLSVVLNLTLIPLLQSQGAALAVVTSMFVGVVSFGVAAQREARLRRQLVPLGS